MYGAVIVLFIVMPFFKVVQKGFSIGDMLIFQLAEFFEHVTEPAFYRPEKLVTMMVPFIGNTYSGASMIGLASVLDVAKPGDRIFVTSYGSGAGSDGFDITVTDNIKKLARQNAPSVATLVADKEYVDYGQYTKMTNLLFWE